MTLGLYLDPANSTSKYSDLLPGRKCLPGHSLQKQQFLLRTALNLNLMQISTIDALVAPCSCWPT